MTIPAHWQTKALDELVEVIGGLWKGKSGPFQTVNVYSMQHMTKDSEFNPDVEVKQIEASAKEYEKRKVVAGDLLIEKSGGGPNQPVGRVILFPTIDGENTFTNFTARLSVISRSVVDPSFLHKYLKFLYITGVTEKYQKNSTNIRNLQMRDYIKIEIPVPPIEEQREIVAVLDSAFAKIDDALKNTRQNIINADELFQSKLTQIFSKPDPSWQTKTLGEVAKITMGQSPKGSSYNTDGKGVPLINGPVEFGGKDPFSKTVASKYTTAPTKMCKANDLILCVRGSTTGRMNIAGYDSCIGRGVASIVSEDHQLWINQFISLNRNLIFSLGEGATFPNVNSTTLNKLVIAIPPENEQLEIVEQLELLSKKTKLLREKYQAEETSLLELKKSLLQKAFYGELTAKKV